MAAKKKAEVEQEKENRWQEQQRKRLEATRKREAQARQRAGSSFSTATSFQGEKAQMATTKSPNINSPFTLFGRNRRVPSVKKWKQNRDGSITGLIYDSKSFKDGTRVTTSPVPKGARKGIIVKTAAGTQYSLD